MARFTQYEAVKKLQELARSPVDLAKEGKLSPKRVHQFVLKQCGLKLLYATERVSEEVIDTLCELAEEAQAVHKMISMQKGSVLNCIEGYESENRAVLHTAMRDFFDDRIEEEPAKRATERAYRECEKLKDFLTEIDKQDFTDLVQVGIGGSELGPKAICLALQAYSKPNRRVHFVSNIDPDDVASVFSRLDLTRTLVVFVSKSGSTLETRVNEKLIQKRFLDVGLSAKKHFISVTTEGSPMDQIDSYLRVFYLQREVGGRYSATSMVGCVALAFALGMEKVLDFLRGAHLMDKSARESNVRKNLPLFSALLGIWNRNFLDYSTSAVIPYSQAMHRFPAHLQQCDMESNGKQIDQLGERVDFSTGPIVWGESGTNGQHSFYQLLHQGTTVVPVEFLGFIQSQRGEDQEEDGTTSQEKLLSNLFAQAIALATGKEDKNPNRLFSGNRPSRILLGQKCDPTTVGMILSYFEHKIAFQGFIWGINSFDQEGVQLGKKLANQMIDLIAKKRKKENEEKSFPLGTAYLEEVDSL